MDTCIMGLSTAMEMTMQDKQVFAFCEEQFKLTASFQCP